MRAFRFWLAVGAAVLVLGGLGYAFVDWWGAREWDRVAAKMKGLGEPLTVGEIEAAAVPDDENFAAAPIFAEIFSKPEQDWRISKIARFSGSGVGKAGDSPMVRAARRVDSVFRGTDEEAARLVLATIDREREVWREVREASLRPGLRWPNDYSEGPAMQFPQLGPMLSLGQSLSARIRANLILKRSSTALDDLLLLIDLAERNREPRIIITHLVQLSMLKMALDLVRFGIADRVWSAEQLGKIAATLRKIDLRPDLQMALRGDRVTFIVLADRMEGHAAPGSSKKLFGRLVTENHTLPSLLSNLVPTGFFLNDSARYVEMYQGVIDSLAAPSSVPDIVDSNKAKYGGASGLAALGKPMTASATELLERIARRMLHVQATIEMAAIACDIERFRIGYGRLPQGLNELVPEFFAVVPVDSLVEEVFRFRVVDGVDGVDGEGYLLYSVGWNQVDDGGSSVRPKERAFDEAEDWVWGVE